MVNSRLEKNKKQRKDIAKEENLKKTKNATKIILKVFIILLLIFGTIFVSCRYIGTSGLFVKEYGIDYDNLPDHFYGLKIIQISDVNYNSNTTDMDKIKDLIKKVNMYKPDIIVFTGDLIYGDITHDELNELGIEFNKLEASLGKYAVFGNDDDQAKIIIKNAGFIDIENNYDLIYKNENEPILINGFGDNPDMNAGFKYFEEENVNSDIFTISIMYKPDTIDKVLNYHEVDLAMAGYSLNGLIQIPGVGGLFVDDGYEKYYDSYYKINNTNFYISSGVGTREYPYRLFNHPSINLYRLK